MLEKLELFGAKAVSQLGLKRLYLTFCSRSHTLRPEQYLVWLTTLILTGCEGSVDDVEFNSSSTIFIFNSHMNSPYQSHSFLIQGFWNLTQSESREIQAYWRNWQKHAKFTRNSTKFMSVQHLWNLSWLLELWTCCKLANLSWNFVTAMSKQCTKTTRRT